MAEKKFESLYEDPEKVKRYWNDTADKNFSDDGFWNIVNAELYDNSWIITVNAFIEGGNLNQANDFLEVGCGWCRTIIGIRKKFPNLNITGIDLVETFLAKGLEVLKREIGKVDVNLKPGNALNLDFKDEQFDAVCSTRVFQYVKDPVKGLSEFYRVLRPGGRAVIILPNKLNILQRYIYHTKLYSPFEVSEWFKSAGFSSIKARSINFFPSKVHRFHYKNPILRIYEGLLQALPFVNMTGGLSFVYGEKNK